MRSYNEKTVGRWNDLNLRPGGEIEVLRDRDTKKPLRDRKTGKIVTRETNPDKFGMIFDVFPPSSAKDRHGIRVEMFGEDPKSIIRRLEDETDGVFYKIVSVVEYAACRLGAVAQGI